jgi:hypothetical protein
VTVSPWRTCAIKVSGICTSTRSPRGVELLEPLVFRPSQLALSDGFGQGGLCSKCMTQIRRGGVANAGLLFTLARTVHGMVVAPTLEAIIHSVSEEEPS